MRVTAWASSLAFALLTAVLAGLGAISVSEALWASTSVALAFVPTGWWAGLGVRRRLAETMLLPVAFALTMVESVTLRCMLMPPLLLLVGWATVASAWERTPVRLHPLLAIFLGLSTRAAVGVGLSGFDVVEVVLTFALAAAGPWAAARRHGRRAAELAAISLAALPWQQWP